MKLKDMILTSLLIAIGLVLHYIVLVGGMKPDFLQCFVALYIDNSPRNALVAGLLLGYFPLTTDFWSDCQHGR